MTCEQASALAGKSVHSLTKAEMSAYCQHYHTCETCREDAKRRARQIFTAEELLWIQQYVTWVNSDDESPMGST